MTARQIHRSDADCELDSDDTCTACGTWDADPCFACGGRGFHQPPCAPDCEGLCDCPAGDALRSTVPPTE